MIVAPAHPHVHGHVSADAPARITVSLPADAKLLIDGEATKSASAERVFVSPTLSAGKSYTYNLKAAYVREGKSVEVVKEVNVAAGASVNVSLFEAVASK